MIQPRLISDIPLFHKIYELYRLLHAYHQRVPKSERYTLWQKCESTTLIILETLIETSNSTGDERRCNLHRLSNKLEVLKVLIRLAQDTRCIDAKQYLDLQTMIKEIGKMIGGWIKSVPP